MNLEDERRLKFDRRLRSRRGWVSEDEVRAYEESLPDASGKIASDEEPAPAPADSPAAPESS